MHRDPEYLSVKEVAERLHVTTRTIYELLWRGEIEGGEARRRRGSHPRRGAREVARLRAPQEGGRR